MKITSSLVYKFGNNIDTDQIYPGRYLELTDHEEIGRHAMEGADPTFPSRFKKGGIIVAGTNFGCGSSREHAVITLKNIGVAAVLAKSFARIFYRNCINLALPAIMIPELDSFGLEEGQSIDLDLARGVLTSNGVSHHFVPLPEDILELIDRGGVFALYKS
ncbi:3-isopropylmalate dehydratase small subunit 1 [uncultured spirochete]|jgi:3-isopropylmalate dehydratase small subunit|uniref:3-isopropylmalate dehydratase n=1 Tax=uncultured spirochete TaxID=156406 RepID=A0A3P3XGC4_9SPIR|nr:3-isopropylmalate dehydratase small subunit [Rectinema subterraneum]SLM10544.1 3-isopropylmalate dehydratase small subunit 1 [uncultured spirochete]HBE46491.1 3-isopropylmalate dehydratase [Spirochaetaceae bacterium]